MSRFLAHSLKVGLVSILGFGLYACGTASSNNDQGASFTALGYFTDATGSTGLSSETAELFSDTATDGVNGQAIIAYMGLQNRLSKQFIRVDRIDCDYTVPGSSIGVPSDSSSVGFVIDAAGVATTGSTSSSGSSSSSSTKKAYVGFNIVSPDIFSFLNVNQNSLPALPFRMTATCRAIGVTEAGDTLVSNDLNFGITFTQAAACCTGSDASGGAGFENGTGTGGSFDSTAGSSDSSSGDALTNGADNISNDNFAIN